MKPSLKQLLIAGLIGLSSVVQANQDIVIWVNISPGGPTDQIARHVQNFVQPLTQGTVSVVYKPGAGGLLGMSQFAQTEPGNKIEVFVANEQILIHRFLTKKLRDRDFVELDPVAYLGQTPFMLVTNTKSGLDSFRSLRDYQPVTVGLAGVGSFVHLVQVMLAKQVSFDLQGIQYQGTAKILPDLQGGHVRTALVFPSSVWPQIELGQFKALAVSGSKRMPGLGQVPTFQELGLDVPQGSFWAVFIKAKSEHKDRVQKLIYKALDSAQSQDILRTRMFLTPNPGINLSQWWTQSIRDYQNLTTRYDFSSFLTD